MKINSKIYRGIEYIQLHELPQPQREMLMQTIDHNLFIKIMIDGEVISQCLQYKDYSFWHKTIYVRTSAVKLESASKELESSPKEEVEFKAELAFK
jgi:hypothetical protein